MLELRETNALRDQADLSKTLERVRARLLLGSTDWPTVYSATWTEGSKLGQALFDPPVNEVAPCKGKHLDLQNFGSNPSLNELALQTVKTN